jgi:phosphoenolpyruvate-protein kinase (PTS system EI component)
MVSLARRRSGAEGFRPERTIEKSEDFHRRQDPLGAMIETPSSVLAIDAILEVSDFLSIGTNDLLQFAMAAYRENMNVSDYYEAGNPLILRWIAEVAKADQAQKDCKL